MWFNNEDVGKIFTLDELTKLGCIKLPKKKITALKSKGVKGVEYLAKEEGRWFLKIHFPTNRIDINLHKRGGDRKPEIFIPTDDWDLKGMLISLASSIFSNKREDNPPRMTTPSRK